MTLWPDTSTLLLPFREASSTRVERLRVGVIVDHPGLAPWVDALISCLTGVPGLEVRVLALRDRPPAAPRRPPWLTNRLYSASRAQFDPFGDVAVDAPGSADREAIDRISRAGCGVLLWLARHKDADISLRGTAPHGAFTVRFGKRDQLIPFWDEVASGDATSTVTICWHESSLARGRVIRVPETVTARGLYFTMNAEEPLTATIRTLAALCVALREGGQRCDERLRATSEEPMAARAEADYPSSVDAGRFILRKLVRMAYRRAKHPGKQEPRWFVAIRPNRGRSIADAGGLDPAEFREIPLPRGSHQMADPFLWEREDKTYLMFEVEPAGSSRGRLGCIEVFDDGSCSEMRVILERDYHVSYPCVVEANGELFLLPETADAARVDLYRFTRFPWDVELVSTFVEGVVLADTTPFHHEGRWYFFTTTPDPFMETLLFSSDRLDGAWRLHPSSPVSVSVRNSRSAGNLFWRQGRLYRPTQDSSVRYGHAIQVNEVTRLTPTEFEESPAGHVAPTWMPHLVGTHTWNETSKFQVIDGIRFS